MAPVVAEAGENGANIVTKSMTGISTPSAEKRGAPVQVKLQRIDATISRAYPPDGQTENGGQG